MSYCAALKQRWSQSSWTKCPSFWKKKKLVGVGVFLWPKTRIFHFCLLDTLVNFTFVSFQSLKDKEHSQSHTHGTWRDWVFFVRDTQMFVFPSMHVQICQAILRWRETTITLLEEELPAWRKDVISEKQYPFLIPSVAFLMGRSFCLMFPQNIINCVVCVPAFIPLATNIR